MMMTSQAIMDCARQPIGETGAPSITMNISAPLSDDCLIPAAITETTSAVVTALPYLDAAKIMNAKGTVDGSTMARYMVIYLVVTVFDVPKKRLSAFKVLDLHNIKLGCRVIDQRLHDNPAFVDWLRAIAADAVARVDRVAHYA